MVIKGILCGIPQSQMGNREDVLTSAKLKENLASKQKQVLEKD